jgi:hypothetical protein
MTRKRRRLLWLILVAILLLVAAVLLGLYVAVRHVPAFYRQAMAADQAKLEKGSDRMLQQAAAMQGALSRPGRWRVRITSEEINGWLAVDMARNHRRALPPALGDPRMSINPQTLKVACRFCGSIETVLSLTVEPKMSEPNVLAVRIVRARAGLLPLPLGQVLNRLSEAVQALQRQGLPLRLEWRQAGADPVAVLTLLPDEDADSIPSIDTLQLGDEEIDLAGTTKRRKS